MILMLLDTKNYEILLFLFATSCFTSSMSSIPINGDLNKHKDDSGDDDDDGNIVFIFHYLGAQLR